MSSGRDYVNLRNALKDYLKEQELSLSDLLVAMDEEKGGIIDALAKRVYLTEAQKTSLERGLSSKDLNLLLFLLQVLNTRIELMIAGSPIATSFIDMLIPMLGKLPDAGVNLPVIISRNSGDDLLEKTSRIAKVRVRDHMFHGGVIVDVREAPLLLGEDKLSLIMWYDHTRLVKFAKNYFQRLWNTADKSQLSMLNQLYSSEADWENLRAS